MNRMRVILYFFIIPILGTYASIRNGEVTAADDQCTEIGRDILNAQNGSAVDAAIATMLCLGVKMPHAMGIGGGFQMVIYDHGTKKAEHINAREMSPKSTNIDYFKSEEFKSAYKPHQQRYKKWGPLSIAIPGELSGYWSAHQRHGKLPWADLFQPTIKLARLGAPMSRFTYAALSHWDNFEHFLYPIMQDQPLCKSSLSELLCENGSIKKVGEIVKMPKLAKTLEIIAEEGIQAFYNGSLTDELLSELNSQEFPEGSSKYFPYPYFKREDFTNYTVAVGEPFTTGLSHLTMYSPSIPGGGPVLGFMLELIQGFKPNVSKGASMDNISEVKFMHRVVEVMKFGAAHRIMMGDADIQAILQQMKNDDYLEDIRRKITGTAHPSETYYAKKRAQLDSGTLHISVMAPNGDAVAVTSSINTPFGSYHHSKSTGIIFNNQMNDFTYPLYNQYVEYENHEANLLAPSKRPQSSQSPTIFVDDNGEVRYVIGGAGGKQITPALLQVIMRVLWLGEDIHTAIDKPRVTQHLFPEFALGYERTFDKKIIRLLHLFRHKSYLFMGLPCIGRIEIIKQHSNGTIEGYSDRRKFVT
ncbi:unnamed protein product [Owenia fusiformis]|uniref:Uncharacterized protein n=1 Tax=Owenia fusiformis TaxID=6347 RepID=A0A8J1TBK6_OWEFU|nr:unnamed protein product [Owenia fusiformis]